jgi:hypothetical protein
MEPGRASERSRCISRLPDLFRRNNHPGEKITILWVRQGLQVELHRHHALPHIVHRNMNCHMSPLVESPIQKGPNPYLPWQP